MQFMIYKFRDYDIRIIIICNIIIKFIFHLNYIIFIYLKSGILSNFLSLALK